MNANQRIITIVGSAAIVGILIFLSPIFYWLYQMKFVWPEVEKKSDVEVRSVVSKLPNVSLKRLMLWEGDSTVELSIKNKGEVSFWYRAGDAPRIQSIQTASGKHYSTEFDCENVSKDGARTYAYTVDLQVTKDFPLGKLFPFEIQTIPDLVEHFDELVSALDTFPKQKETVEITDRSGTREFTKDPQSMYSFRMPTYSTPLLFKPMNMIMKGPGENAICYYYLRSL